MTAAGSDGQQEREAQLLARWERLAPTQDLFVEVLVARVRMGDKIWTYGSRHRRTAEQLERLGFVGWWKDGVVENTILVAPSDDLLAWMDAHPYTPVGAS